MSSRTVHHPRGSEARAAERLRLLTTRLKIYIWSAQEEGEPSAGFGLVGDVSPTGVGVFASRPFTVGASVRLGFEHLDGITFRGVVAWSNRYSLEQKFVGHEALQYRVGIRCQFGSEAERQRFIAYQKELQSRALLIRAES